MKVFFLFFSKFSDISIYNKTYVTSLEIYIAKINEYIRNTFSKCIGEAEKIPDNEKFIENILHKIGLLLFNPNLSIENATNNEKFIMQNFVDNFYKFLNSTFCAEDMTFNFIQQIIKTCSKPEYLHELLKKYMRFIMKKYTLYAQSQLNMLSQFLPKTDFEKSKFIFPPRKEDLESQSIFYPINDFFTRTPKRTINPDIEPIELFIENLMSKVFFYSYKKRNLIL